MARRFETAVTLVGGAPFSASDLARAEAHAPRLIAADGGADRLLELGRMPAMVVGDMDSLDNLEAWRRRGPGVEVLQLAEQDTTDFEKCLYATDAPQYVALGVTGGRLDHTLAALHTMLRRPDKRVVILGEADAMAFLPPGRKTVLELAPGARVSLFPFAETAGIHSEGLEWPVDGLVFAPGRQSGTSNRAVSGRVVLAVDRPGCLLMLEQEALAALIRAISNAER